MNIISFTIYFYYFTLFSFSFNSNSYELEKSTRGNELRDYIKFYIEFNKANEEFCTSYLYNTFISSDILNNSNIWFYDDNYYIIYQCSFATSILNMRMPVFENGRYNLDDWRIFVPISKLKSFTHLKDDEVLKDMYKSNFVIKTH